MGRKLDLIFVSDPFSILLLQLFIGQDRIALQVSLTSVDEVTIEVKFLSLNFGNHFAPGYPWLLVRIPIAGLTKSLN